MTISESAFPILEQSKIHKIWLLMQRIYQVVRRKVWRYIPEIVNLIVTLPAASWALSIALCACRSMPWLTLRAIGVRYCTPHDISRLA